MNTETDANLIKENHTNSKLSLNSYFKIREFEADGKVYEKL
jgi:hypothetical protein